eukprot:934814-Alexandrium_andersonii.AAC.1
MAAEPPRNAGRRRAAQLRHERAAAEAAEALRAAAQEGQQQAEGQDQAMAVDIAIPDDDETELG